MNAKIITYRTVGLADFGVFILLVLWGIADSTAWKVAFISSAEVMMIFAWIMLWLVEKR